MTYSNEFKEQAFKVCIPFGTARLVINALERNHHAKVRNLLEDMLDDPWLYVNGNLGSNRKVKPDKIETHKDRLDLYSEFMDNYLQHIDGRVLQ